MLCISVDIHKTISTTNITLFNVPIHPLKGAWIFTLGESEAVYKTISTTITTIIAITILLGENVIVYKQLPQLISPIFKSSPMNNGET